MGFSWKAGGSAKHAGGCQGEIRLKRVEKKSIKAMLENSFFPNKLGKQFLLVAVARSGRRRLNPEEEFVYNLLKPSSFESRDSLWFLWLGRTRGTGHTRLAFM